MWQSFETSKHVIMDLKCLVLRRTVSTCDDYCRKRDYIKDDVFIDAEFLTISGV